MKIQEYSHLNILLNIPEFQIILPSWQEFPHKKKRFTNMKLFVCDLGSQFCKSIFQQKWLNLLALQYSLCVNRISLTVEADNGLRWRVKWIESTLYPLQHCIVSTHCICTIKHSALPEDKVFNYSTYLVLLH